VAQSFWIPTGSMKPNIEIKDRIIAYKLFYDLDDVDRGDIIVFKFPLNPKENFVKRAIGLPGDEVRIKEKKVYINGKLLSEPYIVHADSWNRGFPRDEYGPIKVPSDSLFMLGDNRDSSDDSRFWGFVPSENIVGQAFLLYWPPWLLSNKGEVLVRGERAPIIGRICMDLCMIDVTHVEGVEIGDEVILWGKQGSEMISAEEVAQKTGSIVYEVICMVDKERVPKVFIRNGKPFKIRSLLGNT
ncbi:unnamed protein product, partial [marine sediment metagenome]